ncbi:MAG: thymidine kinase [Bacteroidetes bacterium]|nr:thymidine kinase [Bacteroidota bacterium]
MYREPIIGKDQTGWIEVICGSMFSGKTEELIRRLKRAHIANKRVAIFKPSLDKRYHNTDVVSHDMNFIASQPVHFASEILTKSKGMEVVGIDEAQFFDQELVAVSEQLARAGTRIIISGLDMDFEGNPFGPIPNLLSIADYITKVNAICVKCGDAAHFSYRKSSEKDTILIGHKEDYEPRCRSCYYKAALA